MRMPALSIALFLAALTLSCGVFGGGETYEDATLADAMSGAVLSKTDTYRLASPEVIAVKGGFALMQDGRSVQILAADRLYRYWPELEGRDFHLLVKKWPNPYPHLRLQGYALNGETVDTPWVIAESELPLVVGHSLYDISFYEKVDVTTWETTVPREMVDKKIWVKGGVESIPGTEIVEDTEATTADDEDLVIPNEVIGMVDGEGAEDDSVRVRAENVYDKDKGPNDIYYVVVGGKKFEVLPMEEDGVMLLLEGHEATGRRFGFGGYITELYPQRQAESSGVTGRFQLEVFDFGGKYVLLRT